MARKKEEQAKKKDQQKKGADKVGEYSGQKRKTPYNPAKTYPIRKRAKNDDTSSSTQVCHNICSVCSECYKGKRLGIYCLGVTGYSVGKSIVESGAILAVWKNVVVDIFVLCALAISHE